VPDENGSALRLHASSKVSCVPGFNMGGHWSETQMQLLTASVATVSSNACMHAHTPECLDVS
jgi:predicted aconitase